MRFFGGMAINEISEVLSISVATVKRELRAAKAWLRLQLE
jgi:DNA-directed RNA polymerase specialized sigma24 family protein